MSVALVASYSVGRDVSGVGVYSREIMFGLARAHPEEEFFFYYRSNKLLRSLRDSLPRNASRKILHGTPEPEIFHALNQRVDYPGQRTVSTFHDLFVLTNQYSSPDFRTRFEPRKSLSRSRSRRAAPILTCSGT